MSYGYASKAMDLPFKTNRKRAQTCDRDLSLTLSLWPSIYVQGPLYSSTIQVNECFVCVAVKGMVFKQLL